MCSAIVALWTYLLANILMEHVRKPLESLLKTSVKGLAEEWHLLISAYN